MKTLLIIFAVLISVSAYAKDDPEQEAVETLCGEVSEVLQSALVLADQEQVAKVSDTINVRVSHYHGENIVDQWRDFQKDVAAYKKKFGEFDPDNRCVIAKALSEAEQKRAVAFLRKKGLK